MKEKASIFMYIVKQFKWWHGMKKPIIVAKNTYDIISLFFSAVLKLLVQVESTSRVFLRHVGL